VRDNPVVAIEEGTMVRVEGPRATVRGRGRQGVPPRPASGLGGRGPRAIPLAERLRGTPGPAGLAGQ